MHIRYITVNDESIYNKLISVEGEKRKIGDKTTKTN